MGTKLIVVDDEVPLLKALERFFKGEEFEVACFSAPVEALQALSQQSFDVALLDVRMPELSGLELLTAVKNRRPGTEVVMMTANTSVQVAVEALKRGAYDYLVKPFDDLQAVKRVADRAAERKRLFDRNRQLEAEVSGRPALAGLVGNCDAMREVIALVESVAYSSATVVVHGESGTGKEIVARAIHARSPRRSNAFVAVNCAALSETLLESELFGHAKGAFTGADRDRKGLFEAANGGTIFLDEVGDIPSSTQVRLLRVLQEGEIKRVGANDSVRVDVRVVAATHRNLQRLVKEGKFREDLFYRLNVIAVEVPPLRERAEDIPLLAHHFLQKYGPPLGKKVGGFSVDALELLVSHRWPGNVRELENAIERAVVLCPGATIDVSQLPPGLVDRPVPSSSAAAGGDLFANLHELHFAAAKDQVLRRFEKLYCEEQLRRADGSLSAAARRAGMDRTNFRRLVNRYRGPGEEQGEE